MNNAVRTKKRIPLNKRIALKCLDCAGGSPKEVTLCHLFDCPLWSYRFGHTMKDKRYRVRMEKAMKRFSEEFKELADQGVKVSNYFVEKQIAVIPKNQA